MDFFSEISALLSEGRINSKKDLDSAKRVLAKKHGLKRYPKNSEILNRLNKKQRQRFLGLLQKKPTRTLSGVTVVAAMTSPSKCPHGRCLFCPGGPDEHVPQSYTGKEPAARRAIEYGFDPYLQVTFRLKQLDEIGHPTDKVELIIMGGTLTARSIDYQDWFVKQCLRALNDFSENKKTIEQQGSKYFIEHNNRVEFMFREAVQKINEKADTRCVGITFEPRPDWCLKPHINHMLDLGVTRVEVGVQNPDDSIYEEVDRGHSVLDVVNATKQVKDSGLKIGYHMMPGIRGVDFELDIMGFKKIYSDDRFKPDMVKIYPCIIVGGTEYHSRWKAGEFTPLTTDQAVEIIVEAKKLMPKWMRTMRIMRDIPSNLVEAGIKSSNLGELVYERMRRERVKCGCIRCREVGRHLKEGIHPDVDNIKLLCEEYSASGGSEFFISFEDVEKDILIGFTRLRIPHKPFRREISEDSALIREVHVYGPAVEIGEKPVYEWQHRGYGGELVRAAEEKALERGYNKILVTSGIGVRDYYRRLGYERRGVYMGKELKRA
ncbi:MAG: tRNA uridine(34) 5-carboxymethylaminomethyl modification radical SAM/GNAT enzyme Elp3 [Candidatus Altiarchaeales archaeon]|nr:tRNA uridine(34) 5-carboxymethylaminomethyl modification radical SAM/GNAT enzyme Elp3 [Candidatus Altiarchaeales archaeon]